ncbi:hypothetical protein EAF00_010597 [Botryotinia globosa]|nr:hypothetical protein EAF00_010597 [Botryotinia globosa]
MANPAPSFNCDKCFKKFTAKHNPNIHSRTVHKKLEECSLCHRVVKIWYNIIPDIMPMSAREELGARTVLDDRLASTPIRSPQHSTSRSVSLLPLNDTDSTDQILSSKPPCKNAPSPSNLARLEFLMGITAPLGPTKDSPELLSTYPSSIHNTVSISLNSKLHNK